MNQLFACYGTDRNAVGAKLEDFRSTTGRPVAQDDAEIVRRLTALNKEITEGRRAYDPFGAVDDPT